MSKEPTSKEFLEAMATLAWRPHEDEAAAYAQAVTAAKRLPPSAVTADRVLAALARLEQKKEEVPSERTIPCENPLDEVFKRAARHGGDIPASVEEQMRADRLRAQQEKDQQI